MHDIVTLSCRIGRHKKCGVCVHNESFSTLEIPPDSIGLKVRSITWFSKASVRG
ncbi:hypothetical protein DAI22_01g028108 [Oryza sativa Japonica Group]|nr:hypothetical protein DAI22_01g028108 [Oryza sativa Japonica Group]